MRAIFAFLAATALSAAAFAQQPPADQDHAAHHPEGASAPAARPKAPTAKPKAQTAKPKATAASGSMGMGKDMGKMHDEAHKPGGMHDQMHGKDGKMMGGGAISAMPSASAASK